MPFCRAHLLLVCCWSLMLSPVQHLTAAELRPKGEFQLTEKDRAHWAFQPVRQAAVPVGVNGVDFFIKRELAKHGLTLSPPASAETLIRRAKLDLIGLPPTVEEVADFLTRIEKQRSTQSSVLSAKSRSSLGGEHFALSPSVSSLIETLLSSPHYGERWGRHWLDLVRYAETDGFEHDAVRPHSWRFRDYVIAAFNDDKPYDRFVREQLAGDELWPADPTALTATGFSLLGPDMVDSSDQIQRRHNMLNDATDTTATVFLGLTMGCARCHDHKFEPISQRDYYSLQAFFTPSKFEREWPIPTPAERERHEAARKDFDARPEVRELAAIEAPARARVIEQKLNKLSPEAQVAHRTLPEKRDAEQANLVLETEFRLKVTEKTLADAIAPESRARWSELQKRVKKLPNPPSLPMAMALRTDKPTPTFVLRRGEYAMPLEEVSVAFPAVLKAKPASSSRVALADWITSADNPLAARVMVNRIWQHHFGRGLVASPSDFGVQGQPPTHLELLDWLAREFIASGWSVKRMHRVIMESETYRQQSAARALSALAYAGFPKVRLEGEVIRDSLLFISGKLNLEMGGKGVFPPIPKEIYQGSKEAWSVNDHEREYNRRSIYIFARRNLRFPFLEVFDAPDTNLSCAIRERSTTAPQSLTLLNAREVTTASDATANRLRKEAKGEENQIALAYRLILGREPTEQERGIAREFLKSSLLQELCRALFNLNEFVYAQ